MCDKSIDINKCNRLFRLAGKILIKSDTAKEESRQRGELFNMFRVCGVNHYETRHSAILAEFLSPSGSHGQADAFLSIFLKDVGLKDFNFNTSTAVVQTEFSIANGKIDILINDNRGKIIIIENKIYAADQHEQLKRYAKFAQEICQRHIIQVVMPTSPFCVVCVPMLEKFNIRKKSEGFRRAFLTFPRQTPAMALACGRPLTHKTARAVMRLLP